ncbi:MAG: HEAT repeat domain-containing protein, partial [Verrucomicrobiota bacterium]
EVAQSGASTIEKLHGTWGLGILLRRSGDTASGDALIELTSSEDAEVRGQAIKILGQQKVADAADAARELLKDDSAKTAMLAGIALGYLGDESDVPALLDLAVRAGDDAYLRHGAIEGLVGIGANDALLAASKHPEANARLAALIALRDLKHTGVESYLQDADDRIVVEAIQAINDGYIDTARLSLAAAVGHLGKFGTSIDNRILNAAYRLGDSENLLRVLAAAADGELAESIREEALFLIQNWAAPSDMDLTTGLYAPITGDREIESAKPQVEVTLLEIMANAEGAILAASMRAAQAFQVRPEAKLLAGMITNQEFPEDVRLAALAGLEAQSESGGQAKELLAESVEAVDFTDPSRQVAHASLKVLADQNADLAMERISSAVAKKGPKFLRSAQDAYAVLASIDHDGADELLTAKLAGLKKQPKELRLDIVESARLRSGLATQVAAYDSQFDPAKPIEAFVDAIHGGDPDKGRDVFFHHASSQCTQCHASEKGQVGGVAGPALMGIGSLHSAEYLLESLVDPSAALAPGYTPVSFELNSGEVVAGMLMEKTDAYVSVLNSETEEVDQFPVADIKAIPQAFSSMPPFGLILKKTEVRDLVAYLSGLKGKNKKKKPTH